MNIYQKLALAIATATISSTAMATNPAQAATFSFFLSQGSLTGQDSGNVSGTFTGLDEDLNGLLSINEVTAFEAIYTGTNFGPGVTPVIPAFTHTLNNLVSFNLNLSNFTDFNFRSTSTLDKTVILQSTSAEGNELISSSGVGVGIRGKGIVATSQLFKVVGPPTTTPESTSVPEPSSIVALSFLGLGLLLKKKQVHSDKI